MMRCRSRADVATLQRRDIETSQRCNVVTLRRRDVEASRRFKLLTSVLVDPTSRRGNVATLGRRDVAATFLHCPPLLQFASIVCSFHLICTCIHQINLNQISSWRNTYLTLKITLYLRKTRIYYECFRHSLGHMGRGMGRGRG